MPVAGQHGRGGLRPPTGQTGESVRGVTHECQIIGDGLRRNTELVDHTLTVDEQPLAAVELHDTIINDALTEILVRGADDDLLDARISRCDRGSSAHAVVGLMLNHREHCEPGSPQHFIEQRELIPQLGVEFLAGLVPLVELIAERFDRSIGGDTDMGGALLEHADHR